MVKLQDKIENALNESRTVVLAVQILLAIEYQSVFQSGFALLPHSVQSIRIFGLICMLVALALLVTPVTYHQIVNGGEDTEELNQFSNFVISAGLFFFSLGLGVELFISFFQTTGRVFAILIGSGAVAISQFAWYGIGMLVRTQDRQHGMEKKTVSEQKSLGRDSRTSLNEKIKQVLTEARLVLPGIQALLGFQLAVVLIEGFEKSPYSLKLIHLGSLVMILISTVLLMAPASFHRIVEKGEDSQRLHTFSSWMIFAAMVFLTFGIAGDFYVVVDKITQSPSWSLAGALALLAFFLWMWFGYMFYKKKAQASFTK